MLEGSSLRAALAPALTVPQGLVAYWPLDLGSLNWGGNTAFDRSGRGNNGTLTNLSSTDLRAGKVGQALNFNGTTQYVVKTGTAGSLPVVNTLNFTYSAWVNTTQTGNDRWLLAEGHHNNGNALSGLINQSGVLRYLMRDDTNTNNVVVLGTATINDGKWHHVAVAGNGANVTIYVDGRKGAASAAITVVTITADNAAIGCVYRGGAASLFANSVIDDARIYNRALSAQEILSIYTAGLSGRA